MVGILSARTRESGFSLLEVLVSITLIGFVALAVAPMFVLASRSNNAAARTGICSALAMERMERLRATDLASLTAGGSLSSDVTGFVDTTHRDFIVRWRVVDLTTPAGGKRIEVRSAIAHSSRGPGNQVTLSSLRVP